MSLPMLAVDKNVVFSLREQAAWQNHGVATARVDTMQEAIEKLMKESFYLVAINGDNVNYIPLLKIMSEISSMHIFILLSDFTIEKQNEAFINGATGCAEFRDDPEDNVQSALAYLQSINTRGKPKRVPKIVSCGNLTIIHDHHQVFCNDVEVVFTPKEYNILYYLLMNPNYLDIQKDCPSSTARPEWTLLRFKQCVTPIGNGFVSAVHMKIILRHYRLR